MEYFDVVDENGEPTGETVEREYAHTYGIRHRTSHLWVVRSGETEAEVLLQKRSDNKDSFPGCWYISSAGHIPAGDSFEESACRELKEELGIDASEDELVYCGMLRCDTDSVFHGKPFKNRQVSRVYYIVRDIPTSALTLQESEVSDAMWMTLSSCRDMVKNNTMKQCIGEEELAALPEDLTGILKKRERKSTS